MSSFNSIQWFPNRMTFRNYNFRLEHYKDIKWEHDDSYFTFYKVKDLVDEYENYFGRLGDFRCTNLLEIGVFQGGSMPFWNEILQPDKHIGIDLCEITSTPYLENYIDKKGSSGKLLKYYGGINQADKKRLFQLYADDFKAPLDIVIDDASHLYAPSKASFEALFPLVRPGGIYIIEDWAWGHWDEFFSPDNFWAYEIPPTKLINELVEFAGTDRKRNIIKSLAVYEGFVVVERGEAEISSANFSIDANIKRRPTYSPPNPLVRKAKSLGKKIIGRK